MFVASHVRGLGIQKPAFMLLVATHPCAELDTIRLRCWLHSVDHISLQALVFTVVKNCTYWEKVSIFTLINIVHVTEQLFSLCTATDQLGNTNSRTITEVKPH